MAGLRPSFDPMNAREASYLLQGLYLADMDQLVRGAEPILGALAPGSAGPGERRLRYIRRDPGERWQMINGLWSRGGGDCEDLAAAVAAQLTLAGMPARPVVYRVNPTLSHVVVQRLQDGALLDPSKIGGMGETPDGGYLYRPDLDFQR